MSYKGRDLDLRTPYAPGAGADAHHVGQADDDQSPAGGIGGGQRQAIVPGDAHHAAMGGAGRGAHHDGPADLGQHQAKAHAALGKALGVPCIHLDEQNLCRNYENRPEVCRSYQADDFCDKIAKAIKNAQSPQWMS